MILIVYVSGLLVFWYSFVMGPHSEVLVLRKASSAKKSLSTDTKNSNQTRLHQIKYLCLIDGGHRWPGGHGEGKAEGVHTQNHVFLLPAQA